MVYFDESLGFYDLSIYLSISVFSVIFSFFNYIIYIYIYMHTHTHTHTHTHIYTHTYIYIYIYIYIWYLQNFNHLIAYSF